MIYDLWHYINFAPIVNIHEKTNTKIQTTTCSPIAVTDLRYVQNNTSLKSNSNILCYVCILVHEYAHMLRERERALVRAEKVESKSKYANAYATYSHRAAALCEDCAQPTINCANIYHTYKHID